MIAGEIIESKNTFENSKPLKSKNATLKQKTIKLSLSKATFSYYKIRGEIHYLKTMIVSSIIFK